MGYTPISGVVSALLLSLPALAAPSLPLNKPTTVDGITTVCTGIGEEHQNDPRWSAFPLKIVFAGKDGQWVTDADISITRDGTGLLDVHCGGPWLLVKLPAGRYRVAGQMDGQRYTEKAFAPRKGQGRVILRFPNSGGVTSAEHSARLRALSENRVGPLRSRASP